MPEAEVEEVQLAEQDEALVEDQVRVEVLPSKTEVGCAERFTVGDGVGTESPLPPPPPPPPPQETMNKILKVMDSNFLINLTQFNLCSKLNYILIIVNI